MSKYLLVLLVACGGSTAPAPANISNTAPGGTSPAKPPGGGGGGGAGDRDGDGILDDADMCPDDPEDFDGFVDNDGCPDPDNDQDGILDVDDLCPNDPESKNGNQDDDGCPD